MARKFAHEESLRGKDLVAKLAAKQIAICGAGALGSNLTDILCRQGYSKIRICDFDRAEEHNVGTQVYGISDIGAMKVNALKNKIYRETNVELETFDKELTESNIKKFLKGTDLVIDAFDNHKSRLLVTNFVRQNKLNAIHSGLETGYGEIVHDIDYKVPQDAPVNAQDVCEYPLARNLIMLVVSVLAEEITDFCIAAKPRKLSWSITLKDLSIRRYK